MSFSLSGSTITQSGTDANLSGLTGLSGVSVSTQAGYDVYNIGDRQLNVNGSLTIDPELESLIVGYDGTTELMVVTGTLTIGKEITKNGFTRYSEGMAIFFESAIDGYVDRVTFSGSANFHWYGGTISMGYGKFGFYNDSVTVRIYSLNAKLIYRFVSAQNQVRQETDDFISTAFSLIGGAMTILGTGQQLNGYQPTQCEGGLGFSSSTPNVDINFLGYSGGGRGNEVDVKLYGGCRPILINSATGTELTVGPHVSGHTFSFGIIRVYQRASFIASASGNPVQDVKIYMKDYDNGVRRTYNEESPAIDLTSDIAYTGTSLADGTIPSMTVLTGAIAGDKSYGTTGDPIGTGMFTWDYRSKGNSNTDIFDLFSISYNHKLATLEDFELKGVDDATGSILLVVDSDITELVKATVNGYGSIDNAAEFYDRSKSFLYDNFLGENELIANISGITIDVGSSNVNVDNLAATAFAFDGTTITIKTTAFTGNLVTTGTITFLNSSTIDGFYTDVNGTVVPAAMYTLQFPNIIDGSRYQIYNITTAVELANAIVSGGSGIDEIYESGIDYTATDVCRYRITFQSGASAKRIIEGVFTFPVETTVNSLPTAQLPNGPYESFAVDGSGITEFIWDSGNVEVNINDADNTTNIQRFGAWYSYFITTAVGIDEAFGALDWETLNSIQIYSSFVGIKLDNVKSAPLILTGGRMYRTDGSTVIAATSNSIQIDFSPVYAIETGVSGLTTAESVQLFATATTAALSTVNDNVQKASLLIPATENL
jgi:hypothetical protein